MNYKILAIAVIALAVMLFGGLFSFIAIDNDLETISSLGPNYIVEGEGVATSSITIDCGEPQSTSFYIEGNGYDSLNELTITGNGEITVDLSKIKWSRIIPPGSGQHYSPESDNINLSVEDYFSEAVNDSITNPDDVRISLDIPGLKELDYGGQMVGSEPTAQQQSALDNYGSTSVSASREPLDYSVDSYSIDGHVLTINLNFPDGYGYITGRNVTVKDKTADLDLEFVYNNVTYTIEFDDLNVVYNT